MLNNQGLEALAALASASGGGANSGNGSTNNQGNTPAAAAPQHQINDQNGNSHQAGMNTNAFLGGINNMQGTQQQQSWQQALLAGINQNAFSNPNSLALLQALQQLPQAQDQNQLLSMQQKMNYLQYLINAQGVVNQNNVSAPAATAASAPGLSYDANQALQLALSGHTANRLLQNQGKFSFFLFCR